MHVKPLKFLAVILLIYVGIVALFESLLGYYQPTNDETIVITTFDDEQNASDRVVNAIYIEQKLYVAANHWPRAWYHAALRQPSINVKVDGQAVPYIAVPVVDEEHESVDAARPLPLFFRVLTGFPPRYFVRLDPV